MIKVSANDIDTACAAYARATGDTPRREGIRVALHSFNQLTVPDRRQVEQSLWYLEHQALDPAGADLIRKLLGLS
jgi:hypothetical protein